MHKQAEKLATAICEVGRRLYQREMVAANDGNISVRFAEDRILTTPTGVCKGELRPERLIPVDLQGRVLGPGKPSSELPMHLEIYRRRPDIRAVVHAHPPFATAFATAGLSLPDCILPEIVVLLGSVPLVPYGTPSTSELPDALRPFLPGHEAFLLANHGAVTIGRELWEAYFMMERLEHYAKIIFLARLLGGENRLAKSDAEKLFALRGTYGATGANPGCRAACPAPEETENENIDLDAIVEAVAAEVRRHLQNGA